jgi:Ca-activated chloride channel family protein
VGRFRAATLAPILIVAVAGALTAFQDIIRTEVHLVPLLVTVKDSAGKLVGDLTKSDFRIFDNNVEQQIAVFEHHTEQPLSISLLVDVSGSTAKDLKYETDSTGRFLRALLREGNNNDQASLYSFDGDVALQCSFTRRLARLEDKLRTLRGEGGTSLYDAVVFGSRDLEGRSGRHVVIVITDGGDTTSSWKYPDAIASLHRADAVVYAILVVPITNGAGRNIGGENALTSMTRDTGGRVFTPNVGPAMDQAFADILHELRTQYLIGYYPRNIPRSGNRFHRVRVEPPRPQLQVFTRSGYYGSAEEAAGLNSGRK